MKMKDEIALHWFRQDLRLSDNPSLNYLFSKYNKIICVFTQHKQANVPNI